MKLSQEKQGEIIIFGEAFLWGLFPVITILAYSTLSPLLTYSWSIIFATIFFGILILIRKKWKDLINLSAFKDILFITLFLGIIFYGLIFTGLKFTSAGNASIIALMEVFFTFILFNVWKKEYVHKNHIFGAILMILGALIILLPQLNSFNIGDIIIFIAVLFAPIGNYFQRRAIKKVSAESIMFTRGILSLPFILLLAYFFGESISFNGLSDSLLFLIINGVLLFGLSKILWLEGIRRISVTKAISLSSIAPLFTLISAYFLLGDIPTIWQLLSFIPLFFGIILLTSNKNRFDSLKNVQL